MIFITKIEQNRRMSHFEECSKCEERTAKTVEIDLKIEQKKTEKMKAINK